MSRRQQTRDLSDMTFDMKTGVVLAQPGTQENIKEKVNAVRTIVPNRSKNEVVLILQYFDYSVDRAVQAFLEDEVTEIFKEWNISGKKKNSRKKKPRGQAQRADARREGAQLDKAETGLAGTEGPVATAGGPGTRATTLTATDSEPALSCAASEENASRDRRDEELVDSQQGCTTSPPTGKVDSSQERGRRDVGLQQSGDINEGPLSGTKHGPPATSKFSRPRNTGPQTASSHCEEPPGPASRNNSKKGGSSIEKSVKDLQRCAVSLSRYQLLIHEEMDASVKKIKKTFSEIQQCLMDREVTVLSELDKVKREAMTFLENRRRMASELKKQCDLSLRMSEAQLGELRANIKLFVSERKYDEELGGTARFTCDLPTIVQAMETFGKISHPRSGYGENPRHGSESSESGHSAQFGSSDVGEFSEDSRIKPPTVQPVPAETRANTPYQVSGDKVRDQYHFQGKTIYNSNQQYRGDWKGHDHNGPQSDPRFRHGTFYRHHGHRGRRVPDSKEHHRAQYCTSASEPHDRPCPAAVGAAGNEGSSMLPVGRLRETTDGGGGGDICASRRKSVYRHTRRCPAVDSAHAREVALDSRLQCKD
uniref:Spermatogenesis-associated serine-rich protein 2 isoform X1 n=1 Tax=Petromyzon marinus TaxID=7757 RepID=A0AAJ7T8M3_PETMA|nr:spermatogenesis-associated serine-rich protein 2 isoform X1 [Petromyzon marinus]